MASSTSYPLPASPRFSCQIAARPTPASMNPDGLSVPVVRIRSWMRFAVARCEVSLVPVRWIRPPPRRRNALREKASPLLVKDQVCPPYDSSLESHSEASKNSSLVGGEGEESGELQLMLSRARAIAKVVENGELVPPKNRSLFQFVPVGRKELPVFDAEVSVVRRNETPLSRVAWSGFAALCGVCIVFVASKLIWRNGCRQFPRKVFDMLRPGKKDGELDKGKIKMLSNVKKLMNREDVSGRPQLERNELLNNIKRAKESIERFVLRNVFSCKTVANDCNANITEIRRMVTGVHVLEEGILEQNNAEEKNCAVFPHPVAAIEGEVSASYDRQSIYLNDVSDSSESPDISLSNDIVEESVEQSVDLKNRGPVIDISVKNQNNVGEIELPEPTSYDERTTDANDRTSVVYTAEKEAHICSADDHNMGPNSVNTPSSEFERTEQYADIGVKNLDCIHGIKPYVPFSSDKQMIYTKDNAHQISINVVSETADDLSSYCFNNSSSEMKNNEAPLDICVNDLNYIQESNTPKEKFNRIHSSVRNVIERSFGLLKMKWQILYKMPPYSMLTQKKIVAATIVLHNFIREHASGDVDFANFDRDPNYVPTIPERYNKYDVSQHAFDGSTSESSFVTMDSFRDSLATSVVLAWN